jgi:hypothetical protein
VPFAFGNCEPDAHPVGAQPRPESAHRQARHLAGAVRPARTGNPLSPG